LVSFGRMSRARKALWARVELYAPFFSNAVDDSFTYPWHCSAYDHNTSCTVRGKLGNPRR